MGTKTLGAGVGAAAILVVAGMLASNISSSSGGAKSAQDAENAALAKPTLAADHRPAPTGSDDDEDGYRIRLEVGYAKTTGVRPSQVRVVGYHAVPEAGGTTLEVGNVRMVEGVEGGIQRWGSAPLYFEAKPGDIVKTAIATGGGHRVYCSIWETSRQHIGLRVADKTVDGGTVSCTWVVGGPLALGEK